MLGEKVNLAKTENNQLIAIIPGMRIGDFKVEPDPLVVSEGVLYYWDIPYCSAARLPNDQPTFLNPGKDGKEQRGIETATAEPFRHPGKNSSCKMYFVWT